jgi:2-oxoglutarate ferredoxin oxidoreductase subunit delta
LILVSPGGLALPFQRNAGIPGANSYFGVETMAEKKAKGKIVIQRERCKGCQLCFAVCPNHRIGPDDSLNKKGYLPARFSEEVEEGQKGCTGCAQCATVCPEVAIEVYRAK